MRKFKLIKNLEEFQGEKYLKKNKSYFEGWYFKITNKKRSIAFIPGISINKDERKSFIQIITDELSFFVNYDIDEFSYGRYPFYVKIGNNFFSKERIHIEIDDKNIKLKVLGDIYFSDSKNIRVSHLSPNIMGIFSFVPFMECNHAILCMENKCNGFIDLNDEILVFNSGVGYIEKDWGCSFPKTYIWCQGNYFEKSDAMFMLSIADIPFKIFSFTGVICSLIVRGKEYRFATYNNTKIVKYNVSDSIEIVLKKGKYTLYIEANAVEGKKLVAPVKGQMNREVVESVSANITVTLVEKNKVIFSDTSQRCGLEIV